MLDLCSLVSGIVQHETMKIVLKLKLKGKIGWSICVLTSVLQFVMITSHVLQLCRKSVPWARGVLNERRML